MHIASKAPPASVRIGLFVGMMSEQKYLVILATLSTVMWQPQAMQQFRPTGSSGGLQHLPYVHIESCYHRRLGLRTGDPSLNLNQSMRKLLCL